MRDFYLYPLETLERQHQSEPLGHTPRERKIDITPLDSTDAFNEHLSILLSKYLSFYLLQTYKTVIIICTETLKQNIQKCAPSFVR